MYLTIMFYYFSNNQQFLNIYCQAVVQEHKHVTINTTGCEFDSHSTQLPTLLYARCSMRQKNSNLARKSHMYEYIIDVYHLNILFLASLFYTNFSNRIFKLYKTI